MTFERAQRLALLYARALGLTPPLMASPNGFRGEEWWVIDVRDPNPDNFNPDVPIFVVADTGRVEVHTLPIGYRFEGLREVEGGVVDLDTALREA